MFAKKASVFPDFFFKEFPIKISKSFKPWEQPQNPSEKHLV